MQLISGFFGWAVPLTLGVEFVGKPFRAFFELKKDCLEVLTLYGNVGARKIYIHDDDARPINPRIVAKEQSGSCVPQVRKQTSSVCEH
jgi:hypothetical protein